MPLLLGYKPLSDFSDKNNVWCRFFPSSFQYQDISTVNSTDSVIFTGISNGVILFLDLVAWHTASWSSQDVQKLGTCVCRVRWMTTLPPKCINAVELLCAVFARGSSTHLETSGTTLQICDLQDRIALQEAFYYLCLLYGSDGTRITFQTSLAVLEVKKWLKLLPFVGP